jgi:pyridoxamine 5'-phosphate oxidase
VAFRAWLEDATARGLHEPTAMTLATADGRGRPSARTVLLKGVDQRGFTWFTNSGSRKARELAENPWAALVFAWTPLGRQVVVRGLVTAIAAEESDAYFATRARGSQLGAWASPQSEVLPDRAALEERMELVTTTYQGRVVPRPPHWGGYRLRPDEIEFWKGRPDRLHDRIRYRRERDGWLVERLAP